jgi:hypothetical protein
MPLPFAFTPRRSFAKPEIEIEGEHGWVAKLPTWRVGRLLDLFFRATGYHVWVSSSCSSAFHTVLFHSGPWIGARKPTRWGLYALLDRGCAWFVMNLHYG